MTREKLKNIQIKYKYKLNTKRTGEQETGYEKDKVTGEQKTGYEKDKVTGEQEKGVKTLFLKRENYKA